VLRIIIEYRIGTFTAYGSIRHRIHGIRNPLLKERDVGKKCIKQLSGGESRAHAALFGRWNVGGGSTYSFLISRNFQLPKKLLYIIILSVNHEMQIDILSGFGNIPLKRELHIYNWINILFKFVWMFFFLLN